MLPDARHIDNDELQTYEEVKFQMEGKVSKDNEPDDASKNADEDAGGNAKRLLVGDANGKGHKYVSVDYHKEDSVDETDSDQVNEGCSDAGQDGDHKSKLEAKTPIYFKVDICQSEDESYESSRRTADMNGNQNYEIAVQNTVGRLSFSPSVPKLGANRMLSVPMSDGRPRTWSERGTMSTGNTYQQLPISVPNEEEKNVYQKLDRGFLCKTFSHPV